MKKILLMSDTHSFMDEQILKYVKKADEVWHAGDIGSIEVTEKIRKNKPLRAVYGNIDDKDVRIEFHEDIFFVLEGVKVFMTHIGGYPDKYRARVKKIIASYKPNLFICGHSHILKVQFDQEYNLLHLNPGAIGKHGFHKIRTMLRFELDCGQIKNLEIIELGKRN